jgi:hypothetical protein
MSRREFVQRTAATSAALHLSASAVSAEEAAPILNAVEPIELHWLEGTAPAHSPGVTWGVPWRRGTVRKEQAFAVQTEAGENLPTQTWPLAFWPDGTVKWTAHAIGANAGKVERLRLVPGPATPPAQAVTVREAPDAIEVDTGVIRCRIGKRGTALIQSITREGREIARNAHLVGLRRDTPELAESGVLRQEKFTGTIARATVEQTGPVRVVVRLEGKHEGPNRRAWLPFTVRLYFYAGGDTVRVMHTFIFDGDEQKDFIAGLGVRFEVPLPDQPHDRHVRFSGEGSGLFAEAIRGLTGLRRDPGEAIRTAQIAGQPTGPTERFADAVRNRLPLIPAWGDFTLSQFSADGFEIRKRTKAGHGWIRAGAGKRASGVGYIGGVSGGVVFGLRDFWQRYPAQLDIRGAASEKAEVTAWLWSPDAPPMDLRFYHDGMGMDTHPEEIEGLEITYEDYEKGFGTPVGIARTSELTLQAVAATPSRERIVELVVAVRTPPLLACLPAHYLSARVFGGLWSLPDRSMPAKAEIEDRLDFLIAHYQKQIEQHRWYGFWDYGDVMHSYDPDRHTWKYDVGGFAWANSELSPDLWLWYSYLRTGRADIFRMAEAMTRHTGEVDVYHLGRFAGLGTRHNVQHWGCSAKQLRISTAIYRRFYYYLTADERVGDLLREQIDSDRTFVALDPLRKVRKDVYKPDPHALSVGFGTDWGSLAAAWLTEWERTGDVKSRDKLLNGMKTIGAMPHGFYTGGARYDLATGKFFVPDGAASVGVSHLSAVFGLAEICAELIQLVDLPEFERAYLQYGELYSAPREEQERILGQSLRGTSLRDAHSRLTAYAAWKKKDASLARRAWSEFIGGDGGRGRGNNSPRGTRRIEGPATLNPVDEALWVSTNGASQWGLAAIQNLALIGEHLAL